MGSTHRNTDEPNLWGRLALTSACYEAVRAMNQRLEPARRIRVIGGNVRCRPTLPQRARRS